MVHSIPISLTGYFSKIIQDYSESNDSLKAFITNFPSVNSLYAQIQKKQFSSKQRQTLHHVITAQYANLNEIKIVKQHIDLLLQDNTYTICTAHQPLIFTGHLYFIYKIMHAVSLANFCAAQFPGYNFVPILYIGSEDNDLEEIGRVEIQKQSYTWQTDASGACGEMHVKGLEKIVAQITPFFNLQIPHEKELYTIFEKAYTTDWNLTDATRFIVHELMGQYGIVCVDANHPLCKAQFAPIMQDELLHQQAQVYVTQTNDALQQAGYLPQAQHRNINLFYKQYGKSRQRITKQSNLFTVMHTDITFTTEQIIEHLHTHPENFSPNVILRPLLQETLLPNIAWIGGGGEMAYWMQLKSLFEHYQIDYPLLVLRHSWLFIDAYTYEKMQKINLSITDIFKSYELLKERWLASQEEMIKYEQYIDALKMPLQQLQTYAAEISQPMAKSAAAHHQQIDKTLMRLTHKFIKHISRNQHDYLSKVQSVQQHLFPKHTLQERVLNIVDLYKLLAESPFEEIANTNDPLAQVLHVVTPHH